MDIKKLHDEVEKQMNYRIIETMDKSIMYCGKYGEDLFFTSLGDNKWVFSSITLGIFDLDLDDGNKWRLLLNFCDKGNDDFNYKKLSLVRSQNSCEMLDKIYDDYLRTKDDKYFDLLTQELYYVNSYELSKTHFKDWIIAGAHRSLDDVSKDKIKLFLALRKKIKKNLSYYKEKEENKYNALLEKIETMDKK